MVTKEDVESFFAENKAKGDCDFDKEQVWGYYFLDVGKARLIKLSNHFKSIGYRIVDIYRAEMEVDFLPDEYYLLIEKQERHDVESLHNRNVAFYELVKQKGILDYDGFDFKIVNK